MIYDFVDGRPICRACRQPLTQITNALFRCDTCASAGGAGKPAPGASVARPGRDAGPGTELKAILRRWFGIETVGACSCNRTALIMNERGPDWCEGEGLAEIVAAMKAEHAKRWARGTLRIPFTEAGARALVRLACRRARRSAP